MLSMEQLTQFSIGATDGEIGRVADAYFDDRDWTIRYLVVNIGGWLSVREVLISPAHLRGIDTTRGVLHATLTQAQVEGSRPNFDRYGTPHCWVGPYPPGPVVYPGLAPPTGPELSTAAEGLRAREQSQHEPNLRSAGEVRGCDIAAGDGEMGHLKDLLLDERSWVIRWLVFDTRNWWPGKLVLLSPKWIERTSWDESQVVVDLPREQIRAAPEYDRNLPVDRELECRVAAHYRRPGDWQEEERAA